ncbi:hypothetical protein BST95_00545 [Halioglobus japonicus]|uniref:LruC domain-containing protein n=1 Tax=Halioglobus japonicus TaxID=930805 RepID=A0AAP8MC05_9GAMM|nr:LruC domain-containing protein [Halioglobus japonicus]AQA16935.1 hypothetical protein BST95_00545 [Halioglobus japonicus]PLW84817.1 LruC domain-containing protein [Halioglobus japonicus]GHD21559.1 LruC domain-containing protein [Halioglobus japonicus]
MRVTKGLLNVSLSTSLMCLSGIVNASPFSSCPTQAFLVQGSTAKLYGVDLSTGYVETLATNIGTSSKYNGVGFNYEDGYMYGWSYQHKTIARLGEDYSLTPLTLTQLIDDNFFVGDVSISGSDYYIYKRGSGGTHGLWRISLDESSGNYLNPQRITDGSSLSLSIYDMAFHPSNGTLYSVTSAGDLVAINPDNGTVNFMGRLPERGTFGAVYFDLDGRLYFSRNTDGRIFRVDVSSSDLEVEPYAQGPKSFQNDGARCALAPVAPLPTTEIDFGDAPDSYGTTFDSNGARHQLEDGAPILGNLVDSEVQAPLGVESDDSMGSDDEDGVSFITDIAAGQKALISVKTTGNGYVNAWIDFNINGEFEDDEQILQGRVINDETQVLSLDMPADLQTGSSWARFRVSDTPKLPPTGGASGGEVEDYPVELYGRRVTTSFYPSESGSVTLAYEDLWPATGDYDMNDLVMSYSTQLNTVALDNDPANRSVYSIEVSGEILAIGASIHSGFAVEIPGLPRSAVDQDNMSLKINGTYQTRAFLEEGAGYENAVFIVYDDAHDYVTRGEGCEFFRTEDYCGGTSESRFTLSVPVSGDVSDDAIDDLLFNPFIFGESARRVEVHLKGKPPTGKADTSLLGSGDDASNPSAGRYYQTASGLPFAIVIGDSWDHPEEAHDIAQTYPSFEPYASSGGSANSDWYRTENAVTSKLFQE